MYTLTRLTTAIHRRLLSRFFMREGGRLYTGYTETLATQAISSSEPLGVLCSRPRDQKRGWTMRRSTSSRADHPTTALFQGNSPGDEMLLFLWPMIPSVPSLTKIARWPREIQMILSTLQTKESLPRSTASSRKFLTFWTGRLRGFVRKRSFWWCSKETRARPFF